MPKKKKNQADAVGRLGKLLTGMSAGRIIQDPKLKSPSLEKGLPDLVNPLTEQGYKLQLLSLNENNEPDFSRVSTIKVSFPKTENLEENFSVILKVVPGQDEEARKSLAKAGAEHHLAKEYYKDAIPSNTTEINYLSLTKCYEKFPLNPVNQTNESELTKRRQLTLTYAKNLAEIMISFKEANVFFTDIKPQNFMIDPENGRLVIADTKSFLPIKKMEHGYENNITGYKGITTTEPYESPEEFKSRLKNNQDANKVDRGTIDSFQQYMIGLTLYEYATGQIIATQGRNDDGSHKFNFDQAVFKGKDGEKIKDMIQGLTNLDPAKRISFNSIFTKEEKEQINIISNLARQLEKEMKLNKREKISGMTKDDPQFLDRMNNKILYSKKEKYKDARKLIIELHDAIVKLNQQGVNLELLKQYPENKKWIELTTKIYGENTPNNKLTIPESEPVIKEEKENSIPPNDKRQKKSQSDSTPNHTNRSSSFVQSKITAELTNDVQAKKQTLLEKRNASLKKLETESDKFIDNMRNKYINAIENAKSQEDPVKNIKELKKECRDEFDRYSVAIMSNRQSLGTKVYDISKKIDHEKLSLLETINKALPKSLSEAVKNIPPLPAPSTQETPASKIGLFGSLKQAVADIPPPPQNEPTSPTKGPPK